MMKPVINFINIKKKKQFVIDVCEKPISYYVLCA